MGEPQLISTTLRTAALVLSLGLDTFAVAVGLGLSRLTGRDRLRYGISFALAEGVMPLVGFLVGKVVATVIGSVASFVAIGFLLAVGIYTLWESVHEEERAFRPAGLPALLAMALTVSLDELAVGFGIGLLGVPILLAVALIAAQAFLLTLLGTTLGHLVGRRVAGRAEMLSGVVLTALALFLLGERIVGY